MTLQKGRRHGAIDLAFDRPSHDAGLMFARRKDGNFARRQNGGDAHGDRLARNVGLSKKIRRRITTGDAVKVNEPRATGVSGPRLVEADVSGLTDAEQLEIDATGGDNGGFVRVAGRVDLVARPPAVGDVDVGRMDVHVREQVLPHESVIGVNAVLRHRPVFVQIERDDVAERQPVVAMQANEFAIHPDWRRPGGETEHHRPPVGGTRANQRGNASGDCTSECIV